MKNFINLLVLGDGTVGKTSLVSRISGSEFNDDHIKTLGLDFAETKYTSRDGKEYRVKIYDTAGQERFKTLT